jgi:RND family efflux transporter MFP subunit
MKDTKMQTNDSLIMKLRLPVIAIVLLVAMVAWLAGAFNEKVEPGQRTPQALPNLSELKAQVYELKLVEGEVYEPVPAGIEAKQNSIISSRILAKIEKVHVRAGQQVEKGQLLIELESADLLSRESQAKAALSSVKARLIEAENSLNRAKELSKKGILANADLEQAQASYDSLVAGKNSAEQALLEAKTSLEYAQVRSPIDGLIVDRFAEPGNTAQPGVQLLTLYNPDSLRVEANIREQLAVSLKLGDTLKVTIPSLNKNLSSVIEEMVPAGNAASRTFLIKSRLQGDGLLPGMYAQVNVSVGKKIRLLIPVDRVSELGQLNVVWVLDKDQIARRFIRLGDYQENGLVEVISGLKEGEFLLPRQK